MKYFAHPTAVIDEGCRIGAGSKIWHFCHIMPDAEIGRDCNLGQNVFVASGVVVGNNNKIQNNVSLYEGVSTGDDVFIGPSAVFTNVKNPRSAVPRRDAYLQTHIGNGASIGANATIVCGITIGIYAFIGAGSVVTRDVPDHAIITGNPGRRTGWMSRAGHRLEFNSENKAICRETGEEYLLEENRVVRK